MVLPASAHGAIFIVVCPTSLTVVAALCRLHVTLPRRRAEAMQANVAGWATPRDSSLLKGCIRTLMLMAMISAMLLAPLFVFWSKPQNSSLESQVTASINFCEDDFVHSGLIAEPVNCFSSLTSYVLLAFFGLIGPAGASSHGCARIIAMYLGLLAIGIGSALLHACLTAATQGGDELPMLWYVAATAYSSVKAWLHEAGNAAADSVWLASLFTISAATATGIYVGMRDNFTIFFMMFGVYALSTIVSLAWLSGITDFATGHGMEGKIFMPSVLMPLAIALGWCTVLAEWIWAAEMIGCEAVVKQQVLGATLAPTFWKYGIHALWHYLSALAGFLIVQMLVAMNGLQQGWGRPRICWMGVPYVDFLKHVS